MSGGHVKPALISAIAESIGIADLSDDASRVLAPDVEYRVRDILQVCAYSEPSPEPLTSRHVRFQCTVSSRSMRTLLRDF